MADLNFSISGNAENPTKFVANARQFSFVVDEPPALGGTDQGANPVEYLLGSYAGCLNVVAHLTAKELGLNLKKLEIEISGNINPARLFGEANSERAGFKEIQVKFRPEVDASPEEIQNWIKTIKYRCPINDNLSNPTPVNLLLESEVDSLVAV